MRQRILQITRMNDGLVDEVSEGRLLGLSYQVGNQVFVVVGLRVFPEYTNPEQWTQALLRLFSLVNPPVVVVGSTRVEITMTVMNLTLEAATEGLNTEYKRQNPEKT